MISAAVFFSLSLVASQTLNWTCDVAYYGDGELCDCGCGEADPDCATLNFASCERILGCAPGNVPWEHQNFSCMASTCGDGWRAEDEACDDFNATNAGGCNADCSAVNDGYVCGWGASGCERDERTPFEHDAGNAESDDAGVETGADAGPEDDGVGDDAGAPDDEQEPNAFGCSAAASTDLSLFALVGFAAALRRRRR